MAINAHFGVHVEEEATLRLQKVQQQEKEEKLAYPTNEGKEEIRPLEFLEQMRNTRIPVKANSFKIARENLCTLPVWKILGDHLEIVTQKSARNA